MHNQYGDPSAHKGGALEVWVRHFAATNQISSGEFAARLFPISISEKTKPRLLPAR